MQRSRQKTRKRKRLKNRVREAVEKSNTPNSKFENIYMDDPVENDGKQVSDEHVEKVTERCNDCSTKDGSTRC